MAEEISLFALMDSHLAKAKLNEISLGNHDHNPIYSASELLLPAPPGPKLAIPNFFPGNSPMKEFLAQQISNTLKAKEKRKQEEEQQKNALLEQEQQKVLSTVYRMEQLKLKDKQEYVIDLTSAIIPQPKTQIKNIQPQSPKEITKKSRQYPLPYPRPLIWDKETCRFKPKNPNLPCSTDISYILKQKIKKGKCSSFGKVLCSRLQPPYVAVHYEEKKFKSNIVPFNFDTKSPGDIFRENERKPKMSTRWTIDITDYI